MSEERWIQYDFAFVRVVPHVHLGAFQNVGVLLHSRTAQFLGLRVITDPAELRRRSPDVDQELLQRYLDGCRMICAGDPTGGSIALLPESERFHWLTAPRSDVLQPSPIHEGLCLDPATELETLFQSCVATPPGRG
jgi:hypothetical protein